MNLVGNTTLSSWWCWRTSSSVSRWPTWRMRRRSWPTSAIPSLSVLSAPPLTPGSSTLCCHSYQGENYFPILELLADLGKYSLQFGWIKCALVNSTCHEMKSNFQSCSLYFIVYQFPVIGILILHLLFQLSWGQVLYSWGGVSSVISSFCQHCLQRSQTRKLITGQSGSCQDCGLWSVQVCDQQNSQHLWYSWICGSRNFTKCSIRWQLSRGHQIKYKWHPFKWSCEMWLASSNDTSCSTDIVPKNCQNWVY